MLDGRGRDLALVGGDILAAALEVANPGAIASTPASSSGRRAFAAESRPARTGALGIEPPTLEPRATDYVPQMLAMIATLEKIGRASCRERVLWYV